MRFLIHQYLEYFSEVSSDAIAYECLEETQSYLQLEHQANQLSHWLMEQGIKKGDRVGIYFDKSIYTGTALYGILKAGAAYVPLDPSAPVNRLVDIITDCEIRVLISADNKLKKILQVCQQLTFKLSVAGLSEQDFAFESVSWQDINKKYPQHRPGVKVVESDLAYIIYTSGSTGKPKGIMHTHHSCLSYARWAASEYGLLATDKLGNHSPLHFDISIFDLFAGIIKGATTVIVPEEYTRFPASYSELIQNSRMTVLFTVPFALIQLLLRGVLEERDLSQLRWIIFGGEPFVIKHLYKLMSTLSHVRFDNMYGPAEINGCTHYLVENLDADTKSIPIGNISQIAEAMIVDDNDEPLTKAGSGELLVRTPSMMQGYWRRESLNKSAFFDLPVTDCYSHRYYRTGDLVDKEDDGTLWFLGRKDRQVKIRGYRVELDEIEATLAQCDGIEESAAFVVKADNEPLVIHLAYTVSKEDKQVSREQVGKYLKARLPSYALPALITQRESFPRTTSDKINRTVLSQEAVDGAE